MKAPWRFLAIVVTALAALALSPLARDIPATAQLQRTLGIDVNPLRTLRNTAMCGKRNEHFSSTCDPW